MRVTWRSVAPIFADVVVSPWNLLIGGILIQQLNFFYAVIAIVSGYTILGLIFILYGGLGFKQRKQSAQLLSKVFGIKVAKYIIPIILAFGQIGWAAINMDLGGRSLAAIFLTPWFVGIGVYAAILILMALLNLSRLGLVKLFITLSSLSLMGYVFFAKLHYGSLVQFLNYQPLSQNSLFWGTSVIVASLISFSTITPDFFQSVKRRKDVVLSTVIGLFPGMIVALLGCFLFFDRSKVDLIPLLSLTAIPLFPHIFNTITNTDGSTAIYTPGLKLQTILPINFKMGVILAGTISFLLALTRISLHIVTWLNILSILFPAFIGVCFSAFIFRRISKGRIYQKEIVLSFVTSVCLAIILSWFFPAVLVALLLPILIFIFGIGYVSLSIF